jgi:hypothetical protein
MKKAPNSAWKELLMNHDRIIAVGTPLWSSEAKCAGQAAAITIHQERLGTSRSPAKRIELGIHSVETEPGWRANAKPILAVR